MSYVLNTPTPSSSNTQVFYSSGSWTKPIGVSMVRFLLIGAGAGGFNGSTSTGGAGGSSGAVTSWIGPAIFVPDTLRIVVGRGSLSAVNAEPTQVIYQQRDAAGYLLLEAEGSLDTTSGGPGTPGGASASTPFASSGIWVSIAGQSGNSSSASPINASTTTFLTGATAGSAALANPSQNVNGQWGFFTAGTPAGATTASLPGRDNLLSFPFYSLGGVGGTTTDTVGVAGSRGGIGCGGGGSGEDALTGGRGGDGLAIVWAW